MSQAPEKPPVNQKLKQFLEEANELCDRYQYGFSPQLEITPQGIKPVLRIVDKVPPKKPAVPKKSATKKTK